MTRGRVLMVTPIATHPQDQGNAVRIFALGRLLQSAGLLVHVLWFPLEGWSAAQQAAMEATWDDLHILAPKAVELTPTGRNDEGAYHRLDDWCPADVAEYASDLHRHWRFDAILCHYVWFSRPLEGLGEAVLKVIDTHDVFADRHRRLIADGVAPVWFSTTRAEEDRGLARADIVLAIQEEEAQVFTGRGHNDVRVLGYLARHRFRLVRDRHNEPVTAGYLASGNPLNHATFAALQAGLARVPGDLRLVVAGRICDGLARAAPFVPLGRIQSAGAFYDWVDVALNPMAGGTGLKIKSVEALAQGVPLVATRAAMTGLPAYHELHRLEGPEAVSTCLRETRFTITLRSELASASRQAAQDYASSVRSASRRLIETIAERRR